MQPNAKNIATAIKLARLASNAAATDAERATATEKLAAFCTKHNLSVADIIARASQPDSGETDLGRKARNERATKQAEAQARRDRERAEAEAAAKRASEAKPSKPADTERNAAYAERIALISGRRDTAAILYTGLSSPIRNPNSKPLPISVYHDKFVKPLRPTTLNKFTARSESALFSIFDYCGADGIFCPSTVNLDQTVFEHLHSVGFITRVPGADTYQITDAGFERAKLAAKRAADIIAGRKAA